MCGRFVRAKAPQEYGQLFGVGNVPDLTSYNVAPTQPIVAVRFAGDQRTCAVLRWGMIPSWAKDKKTSYINARGETLGDKPAFRSAFKRRRCLILADGYYEWKTEGKKKQPFYYSMKDDRPIAFAGIWDVWTESQADANAEGAAIESCAIITTAANELARLVHDRMPVILRGTDADAWIDPAVEDPAVLLQMLRPWPAESLPLHKRPGSWLHGSWPVVGEFPSKPADEVFGTSGDSEYLIPRLGASSMHARRYAYFLLALRRGLAYKKSR
ncbi:MAG: SOS response-associated peptidase [Planctomycetes bacterium]|nr:SOS response-associated peptidase [Planctomycetota bacterium]